MHAAVYEFLLPLGVAGHVIEFGSRDVNGNVRALVAGTYHGIDLEAGVNVDEVGDVTQMTFAGDADVVLCLEVLEHAPDPAAVCNAARDALKRGGRFVMTCATDPRAPHSAHDGGEPLAGEHYANIDPFLFEQAVAPWGDVVELEVDTAAGDLRAVVVKR